MKTLERGLGEREYIESFVKVKKFLETHNGKAVTADEAQSISSDLENILAIYERVRSYDSARKRVTLSNEVKVLLKTLGHSI